MSVRVKISGRIEFKSNPPAVSAQLRESAFQVNFTQNTGIPNSKMNIFFLYRSDPRVRGRGSRTGQVQRLPAHRPAGRAAPPQGVKAGAYVRHHGHADILAVSI